ncbi:HAD family hydrolase [Rhodoferax sp.]|uniref:HAD family hydrolase n=1 Tax=Rhodoferax sp. TaxID=50421 RepID=UPI0025FD7043|nr:HAD family hydrolase [Rhodoferax sp.]MCM2295576.1 HAD family hydrolase [Rhodoferax sp.]
MAITEFFETVVVLDLDDTLYKEADYHASGFAEVCRWIEQLYGKSLALDLLALQKAGEPDLLAGLCRVAGLPISVKESLLWIYRLHEPAIRLTPFVQDLLERLQTKCNLAIITDGRSISQRQKIKALGLSRFPAYISEDYGADKPSPLRFELIMRHMPASRQIYVGDNPKKDFLAPNSLGWTTLGLRDDGRNIHSQNLDGLQPEQLPQFWIDSLDEILNYIC